MTIDWTINLGNILTICGFFGGGLAFAFAIRLDVQSLKLQETTTADRIEALERDMHRLAEVLIAVAVQDERLNSHSDRIHTLEKRCAA